MTGQNQDPWAIPEEQESGKFAQSTIQSTEQISKNTGKPFPVWEFVMTPIEPHYQIIIEKYATFWDSYTKVVHPALEQLISTGKLKAFSELEGDNFVKWDWGEYKSRAYKDIKYFLDNNPDRIGTDPHGQYIIKKAIMILDVFSTEAEWREAADVDEQPTIISSQVAIPSPQVIQAMLEVIKAYKTDIPKMISSIQSDQFKAYINDPRIKEAIVNVVLAEDGATHQAIMLSEVNSHFKALYLTEQDLELPF